MLVFGGWLALRNFIFNAKAAKISKSAAARKIAQS
jgi:hypothetical protein